MIRLIVTFSILIIFNSINCIGFTPKVVAGSLSYFSTSPLSYTVNLEFYTTCSDSTSIDSIPLQIYSPLNCGNNQTVYLKFQYNNTAFFNCPSDGPCIDSLNDCGGFIKHYYTGIISLDTICTDWHLQVNTIRPNNITNLSNLSQGSLLAIINNVSRPSNASTVTTQNPFYITGTNFPFYYVSGPLEPDQDSLNIVIENSLDSSSFVYPANAIFNASYNLLNPLGPFSSFSLVPNIGTIQCNTSQTGLYVFSLKFEEYDKSTNLFVGSTIKDFLIFASPCYSNSVNFINPTSPHINILNGFAAASTETAYDIIMPPSQASGFKVQFTPKIFSNFKKITCNNTDSAVGSQFSYSINQQLNNPPLHTIDFNWSPQPTDTGIHKIEFKISDSIGCYPFSDINFITKIKVGNYPTSNNSISMATSILCYPNPANNWLIYQPAQQNVFEQDIEIRNMINQEVSIKAFTVESKYIKYDISLLAQGLYFLHDKANGSITKFQVRR